MKRSVYSLRYVELVVLLKNANPKFVQSLETKLLYHTQFEFLTDIFVIVEVAKQSEQFSREFYQGMFEKTVQMMKKEKGGSADVVLVMKLFEDKTELLEEMLEAGMKEHIAQDVV
jgi:hypothetical protein